MRYGIESGSQRLLDLMRKGYNVQTISNTIRYAFESDIWNHINLLVGFPGEEDRDIEETISFLEENANNYIHSVRMNPFYLSPDSPIARNPEQYWNTKSLNEYGSFVRNKQHPTWIGKTLDKDDLMRKSCIVGVQTSKGISRKEFNSKFGHDPKDVFSSVLDEAIELGLFTLTYIKPTELGYFFGDEISTNFYSQDIKDELKRSGMRYGMFFEEDRYV